MADPQFLDTPRPEDQVQFIDTPAPERGLFGQTITPDTTSQHGWDIAAGKPIPMAPESEIRNEPGLQDVSVPDALAIQGAAGLGKLGVGLAGKGVGAALDAIPMTENMVPSIGRVANNQTLKSLGGSMGQLNQMAQGSGGREALDQAAKYARDKGLTDVLSTGIGRENQLNSLLKSTGKAAGDFRAEAGNAQPGILDAVESDVMKKYGPKSLRSGEAPAVQKTLEAVRNLPVQEGAKTGPVHALFDYNDPITGKSSYKIYGDPKLTGIETTGNVPYETLQAKGIQVVGQTPKAAKSGDVPLDKLPMSHAQLAKSATDINEYAAGNKMYQPVNAQTDVANALSRENNAGIVQSLGSDKGKQYMGTLEEQSQLHPLEHLQKRGELREMAGRGGQSMGKAFVQKLADAAGYRLTAKTAGAIHDLLVGEGVPKATAQAAPSLSRMVPAALTDFLEKKYGRKP